MYEFIPSNLPVKSVSNSSKISFSDPKRRTHRCHCFEGIPFWSPKKNTATNALLTLWNDYLSTKIHLKIDQKFHQNERTMTIRWNLHWIFVARPRLFQNRVAWCYMALHLCYLSCKSFKFTLRRIESDHGMSAKCFQVGREIGSKKNFTPPKFNIDPEKWRLEDEFPFGIAMDCLFLGAMSIRKAFPLMFSFG